MNRVFKTKWLVILVCFFLMCEGIAGELVFTTKKWETAVAGNPNFVFNFKLVNLGSSVTISCDTNDTTATVTLSQRDATSDPYKNVMEKYKNSIIKVGQTFVIEVTASQHNGYYQCTARTEKDSEIELELGRLRVSEISPVTIPVIIPFLDVFNIETGGNENVTCKTKGLPTTEESILTWFRNNSGVLTKIDKSKVIREGLLDNGDHIDIEILLFKNFGISDVGTYVCQRKLGTADPTYKSIKIELQPDVEPSITFPDIPFNLSNPIYIKPGIRIFSLRCSTGGSPRPNKSWRKNNKTVHTCPNIYNPDCIYSLVVTSHETHSGVYECVAENILKTVSRSISIQVLDPPILNKLTLTKVASYEEDFELSCTVKSGNPMPFMKWEFQPETCHPQSTKPCNPRESDWKTFPKQSPDVKTPTKFSYIIATKTKSNYFYRCIATNQQGNDTYTIALIRKEEARSQFRISPAGNYTVTEEDKLEIQCSSDAYIFETVKLTKNGVDLPSSESIVDNIRYTTFTIESVEMTSSGIYRCEAILKRGGSRTLQNNIFVQKLMKPKIDGFADMVVSQDNISNMNITCMVTGHPPPAVTIKFNGEEITKDIDDIGRCDSAISGIYKSRKINNVLYICKINFTEHEGNFECIASNRAGSAMKRMNLTILAKPQIVNWKKTLIAGTEVNCISRANPPAMVSWFRFDKHTNTSTFISSRKKVDILYLGNDVEDGSDMYMCTASSKLGNATEYVQILAGGGTRAIKGDITKNTIIVVIVIAAIIILVALILILWYRRHLKQQYALYLEPNEDWQMDPDRSLFEQSSELPYDLAWEFPRENVLLVKTLGSGAFGQVWLAEAEGIHGFNPRDKTSAAVKRRRSLARTRRKYHSLSIRYKKQAEEVSVLEKTVVAVKTLKDDAAEGEYKDLASELKILIHLGEHKNIVNILGACTTNGKLYVILEYCPHGNLLNFLRGKRETFQPVWAKHETDMKDEFTYIDLVMIVMQVAKGMDFLQSQKCVHRDLAARNILVGDDYIMKIADFGLARDIYKNEFYLKETTGLLPVKWMAPESLFDKVYTAMSDVWSYGILLWEVFALGGSPYPGLPTEDLFSFLEKGKRMDPPEMCPKGVYEIMMECWTRSPYERPMFLQICHRLEAVLKNNIPLGSDYLDFTDSKENDYLMPEDKARSNEYLEATGHINDMSTDENSPLSLAPSSNVETEPLMHDAVAV
ncbi:fibroblast growth factor receptor 2-like [Hydractinia symbiolongicarpus]|uniref:fibroblast growth factor receptor 2-like n=1 Tax=Hydractinia symbiolongicarpus TaxID=13093 RepID=UPI0025501A09|nr:fibroblast growth factor receptor 2-like [Hydractinia symbiolongicarpus]